MPGQVSPTAPPVERTDRRSDRRQRHMNLDNARGRNNKGEPIDSPRPKFVSPTVHRLRGHFFFCSFLAASIK